MKSNMLILITFMSLVFFPTNAENNKSRLSLELNTGASLATGHIDQTNLNPGFGFEGLAHYRILKHWGLYAGWGWNRFGADDSFAGRDVCFEETGYIFGLQFMHPVARGPFSYYVRVGYLYNHIEIEDAEGSIINDSKHGPGLQLGAGVNLSLNAKWELTTGLKYNYLQRTIQTYEIDHQYISLCLGFIRSF